MRLHRPHNFYYLKKARGNLRQYYPFKTALFMKPAKPVILRLVDFLAKNHRPIISSAVHRDNWNSV